MSHERIVRRPVRLYLTVEETERLTALATFLGITKGQAIKAAVERMYREELGGISSDERARRLLDKKA